MLDLMVSIWIRAWLVRACVFLCASLGLTAAAQTTAITPPQKSATQTAAAQSVYVLGDSIAQGLMLDGFPTKLNARTPAQTRINFDGARSITTPGNQVARSGLDAVDDDRAFIATASTIVVVLGMNQMEPSFAAAQAALIAKLKAIAPKAKYFWVDIGATIAPQASAWSERNRIIYANAKPLGYQVVSRYQAIFGASADPLRIEPGKNFDGWASEPGYGGPGNVHGLYDRLSAALVDAIAPDPATACQHPNALNAYVLGDSIAYGLQVIGFEPRLRAQLGGQLHVSADPGRSITAPGNLLRKSALDSVRDDAKRIASAKVVVVILGTNQTEGSFADAQQILMRELKALAPQARYYWVDIGATIADQAPGWSARNKTIYAQAPELGYEVVSRYKAIFGPNADPLNIPPGRNFPGWISELGYTSPGNVHGMGAELGQALLNALPKPNLDGAVACGN